jgi:two-component system sensor histidine kinase AlgZ
MKPASRLPIQSAFLPISRIVVSNAAFWLVLCLIGAVGSYSDAVRNHDDISFIHLLKGWCWNHVPVCVLGIAVHLINRRWPDYFVNPARIAAGYGLILMLFLPCELLFIAAHSRLAEGAPLTFQLAWLRVLEMRRFTWFTELAWTSGTYVAVVALCVWRRHRQRERTWLQAERDNLSLRLQILRGQLEPHFMFNALNAISALVRSDDRALALAGIRRLSDLLRYALAASEREWVVLANELQFTRDYLALQRLRYGDRLQARIEGDSADVLSADCPPLLLQPLVENALRHGLDCHAGHGAVHIAFAARDHELVVRIVNPLIPGTTPNAGAGTGLRNVRARLYSAYGSAAQLRAEPETDRFVVEMRMPMYGADAENYQAVVAR